MRDNLVRQWKTCHNAALQAHCLFIQLGGLGGQWSSSHQAIGVSPLGGASALAVFALLKPLVGSEIWQGWPIRFPTLTSQLSVGIQLPGNSRTWDKDSRVSIQIFARWPILRGGSRVSGILADGAAPCSTATPEIQMFWFRESGFVLLIDIYEHSSCLNLPVNCISYAKITLPRFIACSEE